MANSDLRSRRVSLGSQRFPLVPAIAAVLLSALLPVEPASAILDIGFDPYNPPPYRAKIRDYRSCTTGLKNAGIADADVAAACAAALYPRDLSICVSEIDSDTDITAPDALSACRRVRRPVALAKCVVDITGTGVETTEQSTVLDSCRRSLLPNRFSNCVVGLKTGVNIPISDALSSCIAASSRPRDVTPGFIPRDVLSPPVFSPTPNSEQLSPSSPLLSPTP